MLPSARTISPSRRAGKRRASLANEKQPRIASPSFNVMLRLPSLQRLRSVISPTMATRCSVLWRATMPAKRRENSPTETSSTVSPFIARLRFVRGRRFGSRRNERRWRRLARRLRRSDETGRSGLDVVGLGFVNRAAATGLRLGPLEKVLISATAAGNFCDLFGWKRKIVGWRACQRGFHKLCPDARRDVAAIRFVHRRVVIVPQPNGRNQVGRVTDEPGIAKT